MKRLLCFVICLASLLLTATNTLADTGKDAVRALMKLEARTQAGISPRDYAPALGEAKFEVNLFLRSEESKQRQELAGCIQKAMAAYDIVATLIRHDPKMIVLSFPENQTVVEIIHSNPDLQEALFDKVALQTGPAAHILWKKASEHIKCAMELLTRPEPSPPAPPAPPPATPAKKPPRSK